MGIIIDGIQTKTFPLNDNYLVSKNGDIYSKKDKKWVVRFNRGNGYYAVNIFLDGCRKMVSVHRIVVLTYLGLPTEEQPHVNHKDGDKLNNHISNLEWCNRKENQRHAWKNGLHENTRIANSKPKDWLLNKKKRTQFIKKVSIAVKQRWDSGSMNHIKKKVIDTKTGYVHGSLKEAATSIGMIKGVLANRLNGHLPNNTNLKYM